MPVYVQREVLGRVNDVFNAETIWQAPGLALFARRPLLRDLLERSPREHRGRAPTRCFSHVTLLLAQDEVDDDRHLTRGARVRDLADSLTALHRKDFGDLLGSDEVRYTVVGTEALEPGQVEVKFGHAVYLPAAGESAQYLVETSLDGALWQPVCPIYPNQRLALIGKDADQASHAVPGWPFGGAGGAGAMGAVLLINDGPDTPIEVQVRPKNAFDCSYDAASETYAFSAKGAGRLLMRVTRPRAAGAEAQAAPASAPLTQAAAAPAKPPAVWKTRTQDSGETALPLTQRPAPAAESEATYAPTAPQSPHRVSLVALALPRLSRYRETGAVAMQIALDCDLNVAAAGAAAAITLTVNDEDQLFAITRAGSEGVTAPASFIPPDAHAGAGAVQLLTAPPAMAERYCAMLRLANPIDGAGASGARFVFGRSAPMLAALRVLDSPRFLRRAEGVDTASADRIGLSRSAFSFEAAKGGYRIGRLSATQALFHLDEQLDFVAGIGDADAGNPYLLPAGHHLVAGHYVLRFDA